MLGGSDNYRLYAARLRAWSICFGVVAGRAWAAVVPGPGCVSGLEPFEVRCPKPGCPGGRRGRSTHKLANESPQTTAKMLAACCAFARLVSRGTFWVFQQ